MAKVKVYALSESLSKEVALLMHEQSDFEIEVVEVQEGVSFDLLLEGDLTESLFNCICDLPEKEDCFDTDTKHKLPHYRKGRWG